MSRRVPRSCGVVCGLCELSIGRQMVKTPLRASRVIYSRREYTSAVSTRATASPGPRRRAEHTKIKVSPILDTTGTLGRRRATEAELEQSMIEVRAACKTLLSSDGIPAENVVAVILAKCEAMADLLTFEPPPTTTERRNGAASALLDLDDSSTKELRTRAASGTQRSMMDELSNLTYSIIKHPPVFIAPQILRIYVSTQASLGKPQTFPEIFKLYAHKPLPVEKSSPIRYTKQNPNSSSNAITAKVAKEALQAALDAKQLVVAMDIVEACYTTPAFRRDKFIRKALLPVVATVAAPFAAYSVAGQLASLQTTMDQSLATNVAFAGITAYVGFTGIMGYIALTTANDQMERVTWAPGVPLRHRWMREEERAALDKVASAWGFRESWRRGEEEGQDWDALREWINRKDMMLDRVELMDGME